MRCEYVVLAAPSMPRPLAKLIGIVKMPLLVASSHIGESYVPPELTPRQADAAYRGTEYLRNPEPTRVTKFQEHKLSANDDAVLCAI